MTAPAATLSDRLEELARRVEALSGPNYAMDHQISVAIGRPENGMTQTVGTDADIIGVPRSVLAAACYIIRNSEHAESETAKAMREYALSTQAAELDALREDVERSEKHRNDLADRNTSLSIENGALKATIAQLRDRVAKFAEILETVLPYTEAERLREEADVRCGRTYRNPIQKAVNKARALLTQNEVG